MWWENRNVATCVAASLSGKQHVVVGAASGGDNIGETRPVATRTRNRGSHGQTTGTRARREGLCGCLLV